MVSITQVPAATVAATLTFLHFTKIESSEALAAFLCLALAHRARLNGGRLSNATPGILGFDEVEHGNSGRQSAERRASK